jgi:hypothetical protein
VFVSPTGSYVEGSVLRRRYVAALERAGLRPLRFHDLRHTFGTRMIAKADIRRVQEWMGHADIQTTMKYLHYVPRDEDAALVAEAFRLESDDVSSLGASWCRGSAPSMGSSWGMYWGERDHPVAHFHAEYASARASIAVDGTVLAGALPAQALRLVREWASLHEDELLANWNRARDQERLALIDPLP